MNIHGIGLDMVNINRIKVLLLKKDSFKKRIFSNYEINFCQKKKNKYSCFAKRFAAKEAFSKALGTGISGGLNFKDIEINNDLRGKPYFKIKNNSLKIVNKILKRKKFKIYLSLTDVKSYALANVILMA
ncbi:MAG: holo-ACP synthase [Pelagibacteraceae bacterium]